MGSMESGSKKKSKKPAHPIDKGWAWLIFVASVISLFLSSGLLRSFGVLFVEFKKTYDASTTAISLVTGLEYGVYSFVCLFVMTIGLRYLTSRQCVVIGGILSSLSFILSSKAEGVFFLLFSFSLLYGISFALTLGPTILILGKYFKKYAGVANGFVQASSSLGALLLAPFFRFLIGTFALNGTLLIIAGLMLHIVLAGVLMRPPELYKGWERLKMKAEKRKAVQRPLLDDDFPLEPFRPRSATSDSTFSPLARQAMRNVIRMHSRTDQADNVELNTNDESLSKSDLSAPGRPGDRKTQTAHECSRTENKTPKPNSKESLKSGFVYGSTELVYTLSCDDLSNEQSRQVKRSRQTSTGSKASYNSNISDTMNEGCKNCLKHIFNCSILKNRTFVMFAVAYMFGVIGNYLPSMYVPDLAEDFGVDKDRSALLVSIIMAADVLGRVGSGILADRHYTSRQNIMSLSLFAVAILQHLVRFMTEFWSLVVFSCLFGLFAGPLFALYPVVLVDILGIDDLRSGICVLQLAQGVSWAVSSPILGALRDLTGDYVASFHFFGSVSLLSAIILFVNDRLHDQVDHSRQCIDVEKE